MFRYVEANTALEKLQSDPSTPLLVDGRVLVQFNLLLGNARSQMRSIAPQAATGRPSRQLGTLPHSSPPGSYSVASFVGSRRNPAHERLALLRLPSAARAASSVILADDRRTSRGTQAPAANV